MVIAATSTDLDTFIRRVFGDHQGLLWVCSARWDADRGDHDDFEQSAFNYPDNLAAALDDIARKQITRDVWFCPHLTTEPIRKKQFVAACTTIWADLDTCSPDKLLLEPSILLESSPGRFQALWLLETPIEPHEAEEISRRIAYYHADQGADRSGWDLTQLLRIPHTLNHKYDSLPIVEIRKFTNARYRLPDFEVYPALNGSGNGKVSLPAVPQVSGDAEELIAEYRDRLPRSFRDMWAAVPDSDWSGELWHVIGMCKDAGMTADEAFVVARSCGSNKYLRDGRPDSELWRDVVKKYSEPKKPTEYDNFWCARPELEHIRKFAYARLTSPWAVLGCTLARVIVHTPPSLVLPPIVGGEASLNLFVAIAAQSGGGKGGAEAVAEDAFVWPQHIVPVKTGSGQGLAAAYVSRPKANAPLVQHSVSRLFSVPEVDTLAGLSKQSGSLTLMSELRSAFMGEHLGHQYADPLRRLTVAAHSYRLCLVVGVQPLRAHTLLDDVDGGTPQRFVWLPAVDASFPDEVPAEPEPMPWSCPFQEAPRVVPNSRRTHVQVCERARNDIIVARLRFLKGIGDPLDSHALLTREKVAIGLALLNGRTDIRDDDWHLAGIVMRKSDETRALIVREVQRNAALESQKAGYADAVRTMAAEDVVAREKTKRAYDSLLRKLKKTPGEWVSGSDLKRHLDKKLREFFDSAMEMLTTLENVEAEDLKNGMRYRITGG